MDINIGCIPASKIPKIIIVAFGAITETGNISIYMHIMDINKGCIPSSKIPKIIIVAFGAIIDV